jgi:uncharacterized membrane protein
VILANVSLLGWTHTVSCIIALSLGFALLATVKGTSRHILLGRYYFYLALTANLTAVALPSSIPGIRSNFDVIHWMALTVIVALVIGYEAASRQHNSRSARYIHPSAMIYSYYMLVGALINEAFVHVNALRALMFAEASASRVPFTRARILVVSQGMTLVIFLAVWVYFLAKVQSRSRIRANALRTS